MTIFPLGEIVATNGALETLTPYMVGLLLKRHARGDWGDLDEHDKRLNDIALRTGCDRILSAYDVPEGSFYVITEHDRSATTLLLKSEY